jgi:hypothetical protein
MRATTSVPPPAAKGTTIVTGCAGQFCARATLVGNERGSARCQM